MIANLNIQEVERAKPSETVVEPTAIPERVKTPPQPEVLDYDGSPASTSPQHLASSAPVINTPAPVPTPSEPSSDPAKVGEHYLVL